ncbi:hypothetical protein AKO1_003656 [Acrasis kona]|uniref:G protein gamma domain-containing protein n=1 Tax=Acrasis kona TaxID=1008807 RepID=A0AAW2Z504_9EUKA
MAAANQFVLQQLQAEVTNLRKEVEHSAQAIKASEAIATLVDYVQKTEEPFDSVKYKETNPHIQSGGFLCFQ